MHKNTKAFIVLILLLSLFTQNSSCKKVDIEETVATPSVNKQDSIITNSPSTALPKIDYIVDSNLYHWDEQLLNWVVSDKALVQTEPAYYSPAALLSSDPITIDWQLLMNIEYQLKYFPSLEMDIYAPVFSEAVKALDGKKVVLEGFVIPFDIDGELLSLSFNPYASCFFCGKASPASVISLSLKNKKKKYKTDDFKKFSGTLVLNYDDPNEFYYILTDAQEEQ